MNDNKTLYHLNRAYIDSPLRYGDIYLVQLGRRYCDFGEVIAAHLHLNWFELTVVRGGSGTVVANGEESEVSAGDIYISFPCEIHELRADKGERLDYDFFSFYSANKEMAAELEALMQARSGERARVFQDERISFLVRTAIAELSAERPYGEKIAASIFEQIVIYLIRNLGAMKAEGGNICDADILCFQLMNYIDAHLYQIQRLEDIAAKFNYNYSYLSTLFKRTTGKTLFNYYSNRRLEAARVLILERKKKIGEIAEMLHYASLFSFSKAFKARYGISPKNLQLSSDNN